jgi:hypothetical protein
MRCLLPSGRGPNVAAELAIPGESICTNLAYVDADGSRWPLFYYLAWLHVIEASMDRGVAFASFLAVELN